MADVKFKLPLSSYPEVARIIGAYAQAMLGATGPVEVREIEWKWGPGDVPKSPIMSAANALTTSLIHAAPDLLAALERLTETLDAISLSDEEAWTSDLIAARAAIAKATGGAR